MSVTTKQYKNKAWLSEKYKELSIPKIAEECKTTERTILYWLKKFGINKYNNFAGDIELQFL